MAGCSSIQQSTTQRVYWFLETRTRVLGVEYPHTVASMANLASTSGTKAEKLDVRVMEGKECAWRGASTHADHHGNLASTYGAQGQDAELSV
ncbi:hypothetical protein P152DRAFT_153132 [Eremomyces bilateralis CBS 781.70]|uniref:Uncharacterized protein n=1 Tax=Eremomyces bilateralis CBS 781.70 TaxID=1392243 RepID=A0A6G1FUY8_9PEZI|nr:uncharacterized protein P152DRAFT_153132 [Eremomyces bilateralis CBS 781.70]KAF1809573.1 hypothetical protein P152DRAFT_153132 [Eremomyces bilateralis CBS 781.70]